MEAEDERIGGYLGDSMGEQLPVTGDPTSPLVAPQISSIAASSDANAEIPVEADRSSASRPISRARFLWVSNKDERSFWEIWIGLLLVSLLGFVGNPGHPTTSLGDR